MMRILYTAAARGGHWCFKTISFSSSMQKRTLFQASFDNFIKWRLKRDIREGRMLLTPHEGPLIDYPDSERVKVPTTSTPLVLIGPDSSGVTTVLRNLAYDLHKEGIPAVSLAFRENLSDLSAYPESRMEDFSRRLCQYLHCPVNGSFFSHLFYSIRNESNAYVRAERALKLFLACCSEPMKVNKSKANKDFQIVWPRPKRRTFIFYYLWMAT